MNFSYDLTADPVALILAALCAGTAAIVDHRQGLIPNWLTYPCLVGGMVLAASGGLAALGLSAAGLLVGGGIFFLAFVIGSCGGGDVKLMAALGATLGPVAALDLTLASLLVGGVMAVTLMLRRIELAAVLASVRIFVMLVPVGLRKTVRISRPIPRGPSLRFGAAAALGLAWITLFHSFSPLSLTF